MTKNKNKNTDVSEALFARACRVMPGGVNSPVRAFGAVGGTPRFIQAGHGARIETVDGTELVDWCGSWGPLILGHAHPAVLEAVQRALVSGTSFGASTRGEVELAECLCTQIPYLERVRLVSSGTEACMTAIRLARAYTGRDKIIKFSGCYHGHSDSLLVAAGSGLLTGGVASSAGITDSVVADTLVVPYNDTAALEAVMAQQGHKVAAILVEPVAGNMGLVQPQPGFLQTLRRLADNAETLLVFDEVITGFRLAPTTCGVLFGVTPDLTCLGKIIGGGLPIGAVGGRADIMNLLAPLGRVYQAGTLSGNPVAVAAGLATLRVLIETPPYQQIDELGLALEKALSTPAQPRLARLGGLFTLFFREAPIHNLAQAQECNTQAYAHFFHAMLAEGFYLPPSQFEVAFISAAHQTEDITRFAHAVATYIPA